jgi:hypothetical protein
MAVTFMGIKCRLCKGEVNGNLAFCDHCGYPLPVFDPSAKKIIFFSGLTLFLAMMALCSVWGLGKLRASNSQPALGVSAVSGKQSYKEIPVATRCSADSLYISYRGNRTAADGGNKGKMIQVSGSISGTGSDALNGPYIVLGGHGLRDGVQCFFAEGESLRLTDTNTGTILTVKGRVVGKGTCVVLQDCRLP